jgi:hypothetical protein
VCKVVIKKHSRANFFVDLKMQEPVWEVSQKLRDSDGVMQTCKISEVFNPRRNKMELMIHSGNIHYIMDKEQVAFLQKLFNVSTFLEKMVSLAQTAVGDAIVQSDLAKEVMKLNPSPEVSSITSEESWVLPRAYNVPDHEVMRKKAKRARQMEEDLEKEEEIGENKGFGEEVVTPVKKMKDDKLKYDWGFCSPHV